MPNTQHANNIVLRDEAVQRDKTCLAFRNHELAQPVLDDAAYERMTRQDRDPLADCRHLSRGEDRVALGIEIKHATEILQGLLGKDYFGQDLARGRLTRFPSARAVIYVKTSSAA